MTAQPLIDRDERRRQIVADCNAKHCKRADSGEFLCTRCETAKLGVDDQYYCPPCREAREKAVAEQLRIKRVEKQVNDLLQDFSERLTGDVRHHRGLTRTPNWPHARFDNQAFRSRASKKIVGAVERWDGTSGSLLVCAPTGRGKTASAVAWLYRKRDELIAAARRDEKPRSLHFAFITGPELANCRRRWQIGEESPLVELATGTDVLILDEIGWEPACDELFFVLDERYRTGKRTLVTSGLTPEELTKRYGAAPIRRLLEPGAIAQDGQ